MSLCTCRSRFLLRTRILSQLLLLATLVASGGAVSLAQTASPSQPPNADPNKGPWVTAITVTDADHCWIATASGLHFQPSFLYRASPQSPEKWEKVHEFPSSLWGLAVIDDRTAIVSDYRGQLFSGLRDSQPAANDNSWKTWEIKSRWSRAVVTLDAERIAVGTEDGKLLVGTIANQQCAEPIALASAAIFNIRPSSDRLRFAISCGNGEVVLSSAKDFGRDPLLKIKVGDQAVWDAAFTSDNQSIITADAARRVNCYSATDGHFQVCLGVLPNWATSITLLGKDLAAVGCLDGKVYLFDLSTHSQVASISGPGSGIWALAATPDHKRLLAGSRSHGLLAFVSDLWEGIVQESKKQHAMESPPSP